MNDITLPPKELPTEDKEKTKQRLRDKLQAAEDQKEGVSFMAIVFDREKMTFELFVLNSTLHDAWLMSNHAHTIIEGSIEKATDADDGPPPTMH